MKLNFMIKSMVATFLVCLFLLFSGCKKSFRRIIRVENNYDLSWYNETVKIPFSLLDITQEQERSISPSLN